METMTADKMAQGIIDQMSDDDRRAYRAADWEEGISLQTTWDSHHVVREDGTPATARDVASAIAGLLEHRARADDKQRGKKKMKKLAKYNISYPLTPGAAPSIAEQNVSLREARKIAAHVAARRRDLTYQDIRLERADGTLVEYAGPAR